MADSGPAQRLPDERIGETLTRLDELLAQVEQTPGPAGEIAMEAISALAHVYGEALSRALTYVADTPAGQESFLGDDLLGHLLVLHDIHPDSVTGRIERTLHRLSGPAQERSAEITLAGIHDGVATVHLSTHGCGSSAKGIAEAAREAVLAIAPELSDVRVEPATNHDSAFIPVSLLTASVASNGAHS